MIVQPPLLIVRTAPSVVCVTSSTGVLATSFSLSVSGSTSFNGSSSNDSEVTPPTPIFCACSFPILNSAIGSRPPSVSPVRVTISVPSFISQKISPNISIGPNKLVVVIFGSGFTNDNSPSLTSHSPFTSNTKSKPSITTTPFTTYVPSILKVI